MIRAGDIVAFALYFLLVIGIGIFFFLRGKNETGEKGFFLGGRKMSGFVSALSAGASDMSAWVLMVIAMRSSSPNKVLNKAPQALMLDAPYTQYTIIKITAETICSTLLLLLKRLVKYCGMVMLSFARMEYLLSLGATKIQARTVPMARPMEIQTCPIPAA